MRHVKPVFFLRMKNPGATEFVDSLLETHLNALDSKLFDELLRATALEIRESWYPSNRYEVFEQPSAPFSSDNEMFYNHLIPMIGFRANEQDEVYRGVRAITYVRFLNEFFIEFCYPRGHIDWEKLMAFYTDKLKQTSYSRA